MARLASDVKSANHVRQLSYVRVLGLALVLIYHFWPKLLPGGFFGVDVFFVFSGYLITALALQEVRAHQTFNLRKFAQRRFFRIFPTVAFAMLTVLPFAYFAPDTVKYQLKEQVFAGLSFITNFYEASTGTSYATNFAPHIWVHLWSLALEVQFYVIWGVLIWLLSRRLKKIGALTGVVMILSVALLALSALTMVLGSLHTANLSSLYYSLIAHIFPFFIGAVLASFAGIYESKLLLKISKKLTKVTLIRNASLSAGALLGLSLIFNFDWRATFFLGFGLASLASVSLIFWLRLLHMKTQKSEPKIIIFLANISYGVYIFHWPLLTIFRAEKLSALIAVALTLGFSIILSALMFYGIDPILQGKRKGHAFKPLLVGATLVLALASLPALASSQNQTSLDRSLWESSNQQAISTLNFAAGYLKNGISKSTNTLIVGDSVTLGMTYTSGDSPTLATTMPHAIVDAKESRTITTGLVPILTQYLPYLPANANIVIAMGANAITAESDIATLKTVISTYSAKHTIFLVTPGDLDSNNINFAATNRVADWELSLKGTKNVYIVDWRAQLRAHPDWPDTDGVHVGDRLDARAKWQEILAAAVKNKENQ
jgi:peptidoglycan/LPS O-acetylase OafA/YrhL